MAQAINSQKSEGGDERSDRLFWTSRLSLARRILAINLLVVALLAGGFFYLDRYRARLIDYRIAQSQTEIGLFNTALALTRPDDVDQLALQFADRLDGRIRIYDASGAKILDTFALAAPAYDLRDPEQERWQRHVARFMDRSIDRIVGAASPGYFVEPENDVKASWAVLSHQDAKAYTSYQFAPDRTPMLITGQQRSIAPNGNAQNAAGSVLLTTNERNITRTVRAERFRFGVVLALATLASALLSLFLARTIARPLRKLALAAVRVRLGRSREVTVPRLPSRRDEIGMLARALSDMTSALRQRIDAGEHFAADVTHELKNPLASLRSAIEGVETVKDPKLRDQLIAIAADDVRRLDRLVTDISEASRMDAELSRARFDIVDLGGMIEAMLAARSARTSSDHAKVAFARPRVGVACVMGEASRLERVLDNLIDNALSFTPLDGLVQISATRVGDDVVIRVDDNGPGVPPEQREEIFRRFHSIRPEEEEFGKHSGLGLAIARTIIEAHQGSIEAKDRDDGKAGARFEVRLPAANCNQAPQ